MGKKKRKPVPEIVRVAASDDDFSMTTGLPGDSLSARAERREALVEIVRPFATKEPARGDHRWRIEVTLDGATRFVDMRKVDNIVCTAAVALQRLLLLEKAIASTDINDAVRQAYSLARLDHDLDTLATYGESVGGIILGHLMGRANKVKNARKTTKWTAKIETLTRDLLDEVQSKHVSPTATYRRLAERLKSCYDIEISADTIKRHLPLPDPPAKQR